MKTAQERGRASRERGKRGEREFAQLLRDYGYPARRGAQYSGKTGQADVEGLDGYHIEVKRVEKLNIDKAMEQSISDAREGEIPIVAHRKDRKGWLITIRFEDWIHEISQTK